MDHVPMVIAWFLCLIIYMVAITRVMPPMQERPSTASYNEAAAMMVMP